MAKKTRDQRKKAKRKEYVRERNFLKNQAKPRYKLDVLFPEGWKTMCGFKNIAQVQRYSDDQEEIRERNDTEILEGVIIDLRTNRQIHRIPPYVPEPKGAADAKDVEPKGSLSGVKDVKEQK